MIKNQFNYIHLILFLSLSVFFIISILPEHYPDNDNLVSRLIHGHSELQYTLQNFFLKSYNFFQCTIVFNSRCDLVKLNDFNRISFFIPTLFLIIILFFFNKYCFSNKNDGKDTRNFIMFSSICFPSVLLSITSMGSEALFTLISIFIVLNLNDLKKINFKFFTLVILLIYGYLLDNGNSIVFYFFLIGLFFLLFVRKFMKFKLFILIFIVLLLILLSLINDIFYYIGNFVYTNKIRGLTEEVIRLNLNNLSFTDILERYIYFWATLTTFLLPNKTFIISFSLILILSIFISTFFQNKNLFEFKNLKFMFFKHNEQTTLLWLLVFPILVINLLPTHAYAKYYLFYLPILIRFLFDFFSAKVFLYFTMIATFISLIEYNLIFALLDEKVLSYAF